MADEVEDIEDSNFYNYAFDNMGHEKPMDILDVTKPALFPQQKSLAYNIFRRLRFILQKQGRDFKDFTHFEFQVRKISLVIKQDPIH